MYSQQNISSLPYVVFYILNWKANPAFFHEARGEGYVSAQRSLQNRIALNVALTSSFTGTAFNSSIIEGFIPVMG